MVWFWMGPDAYTAKEVVDEMNGKAGMIWQWGALDFAGGTVVHINAAVAGLVGAFMIGKRIGYGREAMAPHSLTLTMVGASLLWVGWFGFNAGSAFEANGSAALAFVNTYLATAAAVLGWSVAEWVLKGKPSMLGAASGCVAGLVAITPAAGFVSIPHAITIGIIASIVSNLMVMKFPKGKIDDALDVFACHGVGGMTGMLLTGVFASNAVNPIVGDNQGLIFGDATLFLIQLKALVLVSIFAFSASYALFFIVNKITPLRVSEDKEELGLDITQHGEFL